MQRFFRCVSLAAVQTMHPVPGRELASKTARGPRSRATLRNTKSRTESSSREMREVSSLAECTSKNSIFWSSSERNSSTLSRASTCSKPLSVHAHIMNTSDAAA